MHSGRKVRWTLLLLSLVFLGTTALADEVDDYVPEVTDRVARISFVRGDVQIRRADSADWEVAVLNLPIVEGDEIATDGNGRFEIQFNTHTHLRIAENSQIKVVGLKDEGIAISLPLGTAVLRVGDFNADRGYFEIDAPKTTVSIRKSGMYRIEAGVPDSLEVLVAATDGGEARVYSADAGFTVKNGRRAKIFIGGSQSGEWDTAEAANFTDEFDTWTLERDAVIAQRLRDAFYDKYYDRDIYGAEDLRDYGEWIHTRKYGYVWRPHRTSVSNYSDWSPYRYGQWRWVPPYGWTWVNDEPWGWATYHHGRWIWDNGGWYWTPYGYYRNTRSWWHPALVVVSVFGGNVCWYPLPYNSGYYNYNAYYYSYYPHRRRHRHNNQHNQGGGPVAGNPTTTPNPSPGPSPTAPLPGAKTRRGQPPFGTVPPGGVVMVAASEFGRRPGNYGTAPADVARAILTKVPDAGQSPPILPTYGDLGGKLSPEIRAAKPTIARTADVRTGAAFRTSDAPLDHELQKARIQGGRPTLQINTSKGEVRTVNSGEPSGPRATGAVGRPAVRREESADTPVRQAPAPVRTQTDRPAPVRVPRNDPPPTERPRDPPIRAPRSEPPTPRNEPPPTRSEPTPRNDPRPRNDPPPTRSDPPPTRSEPKPDPPAERKSKDGRSE